MHIRNAISDILADRPDSLAYRGTSMGRMDNDNVMAVIKTRIKLTMHKSFN